MIQNSAGNLSWIGKSLFFHSAVATGRNMKSDNFYQGNAAFNLNKPLYRILPKNNLGGVIFGCTKATMKECLQKQLFGLPKEHISYVKHIEPGLPLFLFNYSDRKLHGLYEAASCGQMIIDPYAWTNGSEKTQYMAQVQIRVRLQCQPLVEDQFKRIISDNYYRPDKFWFELDYAQASKLTSLLASFAIAPISSIPQHYTNYWSNRCVSLREGNEEIISLPPKNSQSSSYLGTLGPTEDFPSSSADGQYFEIFPPDVTSGEITEKDLLLSKLKSIVLNDGPKDFPSRGHLQDSPSVHDNSSMQKGSILTPIDPEEGREESSEWSYDNNISMEKLIQEVQELKSFKKEQGKKVSYLEEKLTAAEIEIRQLKDNYSMLASVFDAPVSTKKKSIPEALDEKLLDLRKSIFLVGGYDGSLWLSSFEAYFPSSNVIKSLKPMSSKRSLATTAVLNEELYVFGGGESGDGSSWYNSVESYNVTLNTWRSQPSLNKERGSLAGAVLDGQIFAVGGGDGQESFSDVEMLDLDIGRWIVTRSMLQKRFALAAVELGGVIYACGGYDGSNYLNSAERFDPREYSWSKIANMNSKRGSHSLAVLNEKIYALGGYDGTCMVQTVEIYDPRLGLGSWMPGEPMKRARGYSAAAVIDQSIYVIGGVDDDQTVDATVECYKEGQGWQVTGASAVGKRCFMAAAIVL